MATTCPYCGERVMESGLAGHVVLQDDDDHGQFGQYPPDFEAPRSGDASSSGDGEAGDGASPDRPDPDPAAGEQGSGRVAARLRTRLRSLFG